jgi:Fur family ferric uptake transcriptional regulator
MTAPRATRQQEAVTAALSNSDRFKSAQDIYADLRAAGHGVGLTTVYRHLQALVAGGSVDLLRGDDGEARYRLCTSAAHHHHLVCRQCGLSIELAAPPVERWADRVAAEHGFTNVEHTVEVFGTCARCRAG